MRSDALERERRARAAQRELVDAVLDTADMLVVVLDRDGGVVRFNAACERLTGWTSREVLGRPLFELVVPEEERGAVRAAFRHLTSGQFPNRHENEWVTRSGARRLIAWSNTALIDASGAVEFVVGTGTDVTDERAAVRALEVSERRHRVVAESAGEVIFECDRHGHWTFLSPLWEQVTGQRVVDALGRHCQELVHPDDAKANAQAFACLLKGEAQSVELEHRFRVGSDERWAHVHVRVLMDSAGRISGFAGTMRDVSERRCLEQTLERQRGFQAAVFEQLSERLLVCDVDGRLQVFNPGAQELHDPIGPEIDPRSWPEVFDMRTPDGARRLRAEEVPLYRALPGEQVTSAEVRVATKLGDRHLLVSAGPIVDRTGQRLGAVSSAIDLTERKHAEDALRASEQRFQRIAANVPGMVFQFVQRPDGRFELPFVSDGAQQIYGLEAPAATADALLAAVHPEDREQHAASILESGERLEAWDHRWRVVRADGQLLHVRGMSRPERLPDGSTVWDGVIVDETAEHEAREADRRHAANLEAVASVARMMATDGDARHAVCDAARLVADASFACLIEPDGERELVSTAMAGVEIPHFRIRMGREPSGATVAFTSGKPFFVPDAVSNRAVHPRSQGIRWRRRSAVAALSARAAGRHLRRRALHRLAPPPRRPV